MKTIAERRQEREIEKNIKNQLGHMHDQYNSLDNVIQEDDVRKILKADLEFTPKEGETWESYYARAKIYADFNAKKNIKAHISGPKGAWWTHRNPSGCFCCEDMNLISVLIQTLHLQTLAHPKDIF